ncbi:hypothetical protein [Luteolibacter sp. LG18]|uniref:hypothetical protein n=1 Tax=Luteolibacter sp. LG18 TaxID=2819286 RepID=UPI002B2DA360|nr:hypothetical protein llg_26180 [Luteolibacter sp. LG18]
MTLPRRCLALVAVMMAMALACTTARAETIAEKPPQPPTLVDKIVGPQTDRLPGVDLAQGVTEVTGVAISPLLGVSSVGAWRYFHTDAAARGALPWFCHPVAWGCGYAILLLCFCKDTFGTAVPGVLKKPLDMVELFENKASAVVASAAFVPFIAREMARHFQAASPDGPVALLVPIASLTGMSVASVSMVVVFTVASVVAFLAVWLTGHAINVLIILSPFSLLDAALKLVRVAVVALIALLYAFSPWIAAGLCVCIILVALWLAPATMRLSSFGTRYALDVLLPWFGRRHATDERPHAFALGKLPGVPVRTAGRVAVSVEGAVEFRHRPWGFGPERVVPLPAGRPALAKGVISPALVVCSPEDPDGAKVLLLLPRYRGREEAVGKHLGVTEIRDHALARGFSAVRRWWKEQVRRRRQVV